MKREKIIMESTFEEQFAGALINSLEYDRFERKIYQEMYKELNNGSYYPTISYDSVIYYHYTSASSFLSIMGHRGMPVFWFSRYDCMNDMSEGERLYNVLDEILEQEKNNSEKKYEQGFLQTISDYEENFKPVDIFSYGNDPWDLFGTMSPMEYYICCFSKNRDSLPLWNYYVKDGNYAGYNIGILLDEVRDDMNEKTVYKGFICNILPVFYNRDEIRRAVYVWLENLHNIYKNEKDKYENYLEKAFYIFEELRFFIKDEHFAYEEEVRIVIKVPKELPADPPEKFAENCTLPSPIKYRNKEGLIIPYFEFPLDGTCVKEITVGPLNKGDIAKATLTSFLQDNGYTIADEEHPDGVKICKSEVPIRY